MKFSILILFVCALGLATAVQADWVNTPQPLVLGPAVIPGALFPAHKHSIVIKHPESAARKGCAIC